MENQKGTAVVTALLMVVIAAAIGVSLITFERINLMRTQQIITARQKYYYTQGSLYWAKSVLKKPIPENQEWPMVLPTTAIAQGAGRVQAQIIDFSALPNVNSLTDGQATTEITNALLAIEGVNEEQVQRILGALQSWVAPQSSLEYDEYYLSLSPSYRAAHQPMVSVSELRLLSGMTPEIYDVLRTQISAFPKAGGAAFYLLTTTVELRDQLLTVYTLLKRTDQQGKVVVEPVWQSRGTM